MALELLEIFEATKSLSVAPTWRARDPRYHGDRLSFSAPLEINGLTIQGLTLTGSALVSRPDEAVTLQLVYKSKQHPGGALCRIEWRSMSSHNNKGRGPRELQHRLITGSHHHRFDLSWKFGPAELRRGNPIIAVPMVQSPTGLEQLDPTSYAALLAFAENEFRINNMIGMVSEPWAEDLFRNST